MCRIHCKCVLNTMQISHLAYLQNAKINSTEEWTAERLTDDMRTTLRQLTNSLKVKVKIPHEQQHPYVKMHYNSVPATPPKSAVYAVGHALGFVHTPPAKTGSLRPDRNRLLGIDTIVKGEGDGADGGQIKNPASPPASPGF